MKRRTTYLKMWLKPFEKWIFGGHISSFFKANVWSNISKAFCRSTKIILVRICLSIPLKMKSVDWTKKESVKSYFLEPDRFLWSKPFSSKSSFIFKWIDILFLTKTRSEIHIWILRFVFKSLFKQRFRFCYTDLKIMMFWLIN